MAVNVAPLAAPAEEPWLRACADCGLRFHLLRASDAGLLDGALEHLLRLAARQDTAWVARLSGPSSDVAYAVEVITGTPRRGSTAVLQLDGAAAATAAVVDAAAGCRHNVVVAQVPADKAGECLDALRRGDVSAALRPALLALVRDAGAPWAVAGVQPATAPLLDRIGSPAPRAYLPVATEPGRSGTTSLPPVLRRLAALRLPVRAGQRAAAVAGAVGVATVAAAGAGLVIAHRGEHGGGRPGQQVRQVLPPSDVPDVPPARHSTMLAVWDRTAQVVLVGGAALGGAGHGVPKDDAWRGDLPPAGPWRRIASGPTARLAGAMASDPVDGTLVLFGGEGPDAQPLADTWVYAGAWTPVPTATTPPAGDALAATEPSTGRVVMLAICCQLTAVPTQERAQTWRWTGRDWQLVGPGPPWVNGGSMVADAWDGTVVLVADGGDGHGVTFTWNGTAWTAHDADPQPPYVRGVPPRLTYDPLGRRVLDITADGDGVRQTWGWDGNHWQRLESGSGPPVIGAVVPSPVDGRAMLYGGPSVDHEFAERWFWTGTRWAEPPDAPAPVDQPLAGFAMAAAASSGDGRLVIFGGNQALDETWTWLGTGWQHLFPQPPTPPGRLGASMAYDPDTGRTIMVGGRLQGGAFADDVWSWDGSAWRPILTGGVPPGTVLAPFAWDRARHQGVLMVMSTSDSAVATWQTWVWDGATWAQRRPPLSPPARSPASMAFDPATGDLLLVLPCCPGQADQRSETWTWDGVTWHRRQTAHSPPVQAKVAADMAHRRTVLVAACCRGDDSVGPPETWTWDGSDWTRSAATLPALQDVSALATDADGVATLIGRVAGAGPRHPLDGVWRWDGAAWMRLG